MIQSLIDKTKFYNIQVQSTVSLERNNPNDINKTLTYYNFSRTFGNRLNLSNYLKFTLYIFIAPNFVCIKGLTFLIPNNNQSTLFVEACSHLILYMNTIIVDCHHFDLICSSRIVSIKMADCGYSQIISYGVPNVWYSRSSNHSISYITSLEGRRGLAVYNVVKILMIFL